MTQSDHLIDMTLKDLRQLATEHQIPGRSRLDKPDLISALKAVLLHRSSTQAASEPTTDPEPAPAPAPAPAKSGGPEVLDASKIAALTGGRREAQEASPTEGGEEPGRKKRRRRRRRKKKSGDSNGETSAETGLPTNGEEPGEVDDDDDDDDEADDEESVEAVEAVEAVETTAPTAEPEEAPAATTDDRPRRNAPRPARREPERAPARPPLDEGEERRPALPPRPSLSGALQPVTPMHERLVGLAAGLVGLCDPETPSWAQAHLSELLATAGLYPTPCEGEPHPDFHDVVGYRRSDQHPLGHIIEVARPGFSIRGDRNGRLFPIRKATVIVAGSGPGPGKPAPEPSPRLEREEPAPEAAILDELPQEPNDDSAPAETVVDQAPIEPQPERRERDERREPREHRDREPREHRDREPREHRDRDAREHRSPVQRQDLAEPLPLKMQEADELAARPKAEAFRELGLNDQLLADLYDMGYQQATPIQAAAIKPAVAGRDLIGQAQTGTGKTAAYVLPILQRLYELEQTGTAALVLCPTRELARQVHENFVKLAGQSAARAALIYGGVSMRDQITALDCKPHAIIGTPGRLIDHMRQHNIDCSQLAIAVLDEADQMLDIGFLPDIEYILKHTNPQRQTLLFSATMPEEIKRLCAHYQRDPEHIHVLPERVTTDHVDQAFIAVDHDKKTALLAHFIDTQKPAKLVVFCKTKAQTDRVATVLKKKKIKAAAINGDLPQVKREKTLQAFRDGELIALIATNVAARGLDIPTVSHVINYDIPEYAEDYVHRIGRTGRMGGCEGFARTFITPEDGQFLLEIEKLIGMELPEEEVEGITASTATEVKRSIAEIEIRGPRLIKPLIGGIRLGRRRR
jgi:ATP-dependent RNA helicase DeaD